VSVLGALSIGFVLAIVGAALLRSEEAVREAWRRRRGDGEPQAGPTGLWPIVFLGLIAVANIGIAVDDGGAFRISLAAVWLLLFCHHLAEIQAVSLLNCVTADEAAVYPSRNYPHYLLRRKRWRWSSGLSPSPCC
jgi:hypothetical protein